jgi:hypothetical protein
MENIQNYLEIAGLVVMIASIITSMTSSTSDDKVVNFIQKVLNALALNVGKNKNADEDQVVK